MSERPRNFPQQVGAVIFDFDETMIDLERQHTAANERLAEAMGARYADMPEAFRTASGKRIIDDIREMRAFFGWPRDSHDLLTERQRYFDDEIARAQLQLLPGVEQIVRALHARGLKLAVTTSAVRNSIEAILRRFDLFPLFDVIVDGSEVRRGKPDPEAYLVTAARLGVDASSCLVFEDSGIGVRAAKAAGMYCIGVPNPRALTRQDLTPADAVAASFEEIDPEWFPTSSPSSR